MNKETGKCQECKPNCLACEPVSDYHISTLANTTKSLCLKCQNPENSKTFFINSTSGQCVEECAGESRSNKTLESYKRESNVDFCFECEVGNCSKCEPFSPKRCLTCKEGFEVTADKRCEVLPSIAVKIMKILLYILIAVIISCLILSLCFSGSNFQVTNILKRIKRYRQVWGDSEGKIKFFIFF